ncbi:MAG: hypothetical protein ACN4GM_16805 [Gammaproteobacteria bacterium]
MSAKYYPLSEPDLVRSYAIRRVNPFLGVLQVIETVGGRASSANGVVWDIEVIAERSDGWGSLNQNSRQVAFYRYGLWSLEDGLVNRPLAPHLENDPLTLQCNELIECIRERLEQLPFRLEDNRELWLFDRDDSRPLALLASATIDSSLPVPEPKYWSSCIGANGVLSQRRYPLASELEELVKQAAGFNIHKHWVTRQSNGSGIIEVSNTHMTVEDFPVFLLTEDWPEAEQVSLASAFLEWIAPSLLTLQHLSRDQRERMEKSLSIQAVSVEHHWHLYSEIIDEKCLRAAIVQCHLQKANQSGDGL